MLMMRGQYHRWPYRSRSRPPRRPDQAGTIGSAPLHRRSAGRRIDYIGAVIRPLELAEAAAAVKLGRPMGRVRGGLPPLVDHERRPARSSLHGNYPAKLFQRCFFTLSKEVAPYLGEYERSATTVFNAYIGPKISTYLHKSEPSAQTQKDCAREPLIMQAYGGVLGIEATCKNAVGIIESGPAAGVVGSAVFGRAYRRKEYSRHRHGRHDFQSQRRAQTA